MVARRRGSDSLFRAPHPQPTLFAAGQTPHLAQRRKPGHERA